MQLAGKVALVTGGQPSSLDDVAQLVLFLATDASRHISGSKKWLAGAQSLLAG